MRYRLTFAKREAMRFTGNLDLHRTLERSMRRANLPLVYSEGFTPRPKITLASALPLGYTSEYELADFWLKVVIAVEDVREALGKSIPPGLGLIDLKVVDLQAAKLQNAITSATFLVSLLEPTPKLDQKVAAMMVEEEIMREKVRKGKKRVYNLRELIEAIRVLSEDENGHQCLEMRLRAGEGTTGRPDDVLIELGIDPLTTRIHRTMIELSLKEDGR
jgi:radical SAM-linked protein